MKDWAVVLIAGSILATCIVVEWRHYHPAVPVVHPVSHEAPHTSNPPAPLVVHASAYTLPAHEDSFDTSTDWAATADRTARAAIAGDGHAAWVMAQHAADCVVFTLPGATPQEALDAMQSSGMPENRKTDMRRKFDACKGYFAHPALLADMPQPAGFYPDWATDPKYWSDLAYQLREPAAIVQHDLQAMTARKGYAEVEDDVAQMVTTGSASDLMTAGAIIRTGIADDSQFIDGAAFQVAACRLGAQKCVSSISPIGGQPASFELWAQTTLPGDKYQAIDARAAQIVDAVQRHDADTLRHFVILGGLHVEN